MTANYFIFGCVHLVRSLQYSSAVRVVHNDPNACPSNLLEFRMYDSISTIHIKMHTKQIILDQYEWPVENDSLIIKLKLHIACEH